jgi:hypothetical protein
LAGTPNAKDPGSRQDKQQSVRNRNLYTPMPLNKKTNGKQTSPVLAKGQLWKTERGHIRIVELGKVLVHYKMLRDRRQMLRTQMSRIDSMEAYLRTNAGQLVENSMLH